MRIAILADPLDNQNAGVHVYTRGMVDAMIRNNPGHEIILVREKRDDTLRHVEQIIIPNTRLPVGFASLRLFFIIPFLLRRAKADVVIEPAHFGPFNLPSRIKRVTVIHDLTPLIFPHFHRWHSQVLQRIFLKRILKRTDLIIANSDHTAMDIRKMFPFTGSRIRKIYPGVRTDFGAEPDYDVIRKYNLTSGYFLFVGTIEPRKGLGTLLEAFRIYKSIAGNNRQLVIAGGKGWKADDFYVQLESHPFRSDIHVIGYIPTNELPSVYKGATALIYPSLYEGFGFPVVEALMFGKPVITSRNSSLTEAGSDLALYFETGQVQQLADQMMDVADNESLRIKMKELGPDFAKRFNWDAFALDLYRIL
jgi:glycosyltransferase involved in cell wall biosynthesis